MGNRCMERRIQWASRPLIAPYSPDMLSVVRAALPRNRSLGVTGALYFTDGVFFQVIEGAPQAIAFVLERIHADQRHSDVTMIEEVTISERLFGGHDMKFVDGARYRVAARPLDYDAVLRLDGEQRRDLTLAMLRA